METFVYRSHWLIDDTTCGPFVLLAVTTERAVPVDLQRKVAREIADRVLPPSERHGPLRVRPVPPEEVEGWARWFDEDPDEADLESHGSMRVGFTKRARAYASGALRR